MEHILVVEDEPIIARDIEDSLNGAGYTVAAVASSGEEALSKIPLTQPDLVLMDIVLKGRMDGLEAAATIHDRFGIPVVYLTGYADEHTLERAKLTCPSAYLLKPFNDRELQVTVAMALYKHARDRQERARMEWFGDALRSLGQAILAVDRTGRVMFVNRRGEILTGWTREEATGRPLDEILRFEAGRLSSDLPAETPSEQVLLTRTGGRRRVVLSPSTIADEHGRAAGAVYVFQEWEDDRDAGLSTLAGALHGFIPICASCKKMRDEQGGWHQPEIYIKERSGVEFTHGICPDCMRRIYKLTKDRATS